MELFEKHFKLRNYLVGYKLTLADIYLTAVLLAPYQLVIDKKQRDSQLPNLTRFMTLNLQLRHIRLAFGKIIFCQKGINPNFDLKIEKQKPEKKEEPVKKEKQVKKEDPKKEKSAKKEEPKPQP